MNGGGRALCSFWPFWWAVGDYQTPRDPSGKSQPTQASRTFKDIELSAIHPILTVYLQLCEAGQLTERHTHFHVHTRTSTHTLARRQRSLTLCQIAKNNNNQPTTSFAILQPSSSLTLINVRPRLGQLMNEPPAPSLSPLCPTAFRAPPTPHPRRAEGSFGAPSGCQNLLRWTDFMGHC